MVEARLKQKKGISHLTDIDRIQIKKNHLIYLIERFLRHWED